MRGCDSEAGSARQALLWALIGALWIIPSAMGAVPWSRTVGDLARYAVVLAVVVAGHELGHALAGRMFGYRIFEISVGIGPTLVDATVGRTHLVVRPFPLAGHTMMATTRTHASRVPELLVSLAGPFTNLVMLAIALTRDVTDPWTSAVALVNGYVLIGNLVPIQVKNPLGVAFSDGRRALDALDADDRALVDLTAARYMGEAYVQRTRGDYAGALQWDEEGLAAHPGNALLIGDAAAAMIQLQRYAEARATLLRLLERDDLKPPSRAVHLNNLAWADLMIGDPALLSEALASSGEAMGFLPGVAALQGTRGFALIEQGAIADGLDLSRKAYRRHSSPESRAASACVVAIGAARDGRGAMAERYLVMAARLAPDHPLIARAQAALAALFDAGSPTAVAGMSPPSSESLPPVP
jgi:hypothetical protein